MENNQHKKNREPFYWVACSGGVDSVVLLHVMVKCNKNVGVLHCNFKLRGNASDQDEVFVSELAAQLNIPFKSKVFDLSNINKNTQLSARNLRYQWFDEIKKSDHAVIVLGHHLDDQIETFFLQLERGGGIAGLAAMTRFNNSYLRPLLNYDKKGIIAIATKNNWKWKEDESNKKTVYQRNLYRKTILPFLYKSGVSKYEIISLINNFQELLHCIKQSDLKEFIKNNIITLEDWNFLPIIYRKQLLSQFKISGMYEREIDKLKNAIKGSYLTFKHCKIWNEGNHFYFENQKKALPETEFYIDEITPKEIDYSLDYLYVDKATISGQVKLRKWKKGDRFQPLGLKGTKLVSDYLTDQKLAAHIKSEIQIFCDDSKIIGIKTVPSEKVKITPKTKVVLKIGLKQ